MNLQKSEVTLGVFIYHSGIKIQKKVDERDFELKRQSETS